MKIKNERKIGGFTLIELILSIGMILIVTGTVMQVSRFADTHKNLTLSTSEFLATVRVAQGRALSGSYTEEAELAGWYICGYGAYVQTPTSYQIFYTYITGAEFAANPNECENHHGLIAPYEFIETRSLLEETQFSSTVGTNVFFAVPYGTTVPSSFVIATDYSSGQRTVEINQFGKIEVN